MPFQLTEVAKTEKNRKTCNVHVSFSSAVKHLTAMSKMMGWTLIQLICRSKTKQNQIRILGLKEIWNT